MIPKNLFFIWFGDNPPKYCEFAINTFKEVNPDFHVEFIRKSTKEIENWENSKDELLNAAGNYAFNNKNSKFNQKRLNFNTCVSDKYRFLLLKKYGGIYLDCDTFPVKPFDDKILKLGYGGYRATTTTTNGLCCYSDIYHIGCNKINNYNNITFFNLYPPDRIHKKHKDPEWKVLYDKFINCSIKYGEYYDDLPEKYIEHFRCNTWTKT